MRYLVSLLILSILIVLGGTSVKAGVNDFIINKLNVEYILDNNVVGGSLETTESFNITYTDQNHGFLRAIPTSYHGYNTKLEIRGVERDGHSEPYTTYTENGNLVLKIGDANKTVTGQQNYKINYYQERIVNFDGNPEFYWDTNGNGWGQPFLSISAEVRLKDGPDILESNNSYCYTGLEGSPRVDCTILYADGVYSFSTTTPMEPGENMSVAVSLDGVEFAAPGTNEKLKDNILNLLGLVVGISGFVVLFWVWLRNGRDYKGKGVIIPQYEPPKNLSPAEVGMLADYKVDSRDLSATLIDLAVRKYVKLHEEVKKVLLFTSRDYKVEIVNDDLSLLKPHEKELLKGMFTEISVGSLVELKKISKTKMSKSVVKARQNVSDVLKKEYGYIESKSTNLQVFLIVLGGVSVFLSFFTFELALGIGLGLIIFGLGCFLFGALMRRRSHAGVQVYEEILGLKMFMNVAEKDRLKMMQSVDRPFAEPSKTVELFEELLPYAVALGVEKSWAKQFDGLLTEQPDWVDSNYPLAFTAGHLASSVSSVATDFGSSFESSSGTSGSSGGGASGGGGGGGGGGGW